jgi:hypothetical protein
MPWYYAGPEAKPLGPVSAEQLQALSASGTITPETFVIEHTGPGAANLAWKRYRDAFPATPPLPPVPSTPPAPSAPPAPMPGTIPAPIPSAPGQAAAHPLFPSAASAHPGQPAHPAPVVPGGYAPMRPTNSWCAWGFALSLVGFCFSCVCLGLVPALIAAVLCIIGLVQLKKNPEEGGQGLAITGLIFSAVAVLVALAIIIWATPPILKAHGLTVTEQTSNDSE